MMVSGRTGCGAGDSSNNGSNHRTFAVTGSGPDQCTGCGAAPNDRSGSSVMGTIDIDGRRSNIDGRGLINRRRRITVDTIVYIAVTAIPISPVIASEVAILVISAVTISAMVGRLILCSATVAVTVFRRENWNTRSKQRHDNVDRREFLNAFHNCLRL
jgi:hypothetical protein